MNELLASWLLFSKSADLSLYFLEPGAQVLVGLLQLARETRNLLQCLQNAVTHRGDLSILCFYSIQFALDNNHLITYE